MAESTATTRTKQGDASYKETIESILVAFILAFIFRAFVVEAFVIPTGSMAPTLFGAHMRFTCPDCGYTFDVGYRGTKSENGDDINIPTEAFRPATVRCPNCAYDFPSQDAMGKPIVQPVRFGDRILVLKYLYLFQKPQRWDVVVFKSPSEDTHHVPEDPEYGQNFIKRLIGNPTESVVILDGNIFVGGPKDMGIQADGLKVAADAGNFKIQRKPGYVQDRLWRLIYDNDFIPAGNDTNRATTWHQPWQVSDGTGWNQGAEGHSRIFDFGNAGSSATLFFNPDANRDVFPLTDWIPYDQQDDTRPPRDKPWVSDLKLSCTYTRKSGDGPLRMYLTKFDHCFITEVTPGKVSLYEAKLLSPSDESSGKGFATGDLHLIDSASLPELAGSEPARIDFMNYDYQVIIRINGKEAFAHHEYDPQVPALWQHYIDNVREPNARPEVRITAERQGCTIQHLSLWHDIYYGNRGDIKDYQGNSIGTPFWASPKNVMHLGEGEYFVLGDNSLISGDARYWGDPIQLPHEGLPDTQGGRVPESFMLGKAFLVYWPAGYRMPFLPINAVPDFGEMRFIR